MLQCLLILVKLIHKVSLLLSTLCIRVFFFGQAEEGLIEGVISRFRYYFLPSE
jgi:hypothetical protein